MMALIKVENLKVERSGRTICAVPDLSVQPGERLGIHGGNGSGKTTLLRVLAGLDRDYDGQFRFSIHRSEVVYVHQRPFLFRGTVLFNAAYALRARGAGRQSAMARGMQMLQRLGIEKLASARVGHLSGGERRLAALARAMAIESKVLLLDEPFEDLDRHGMQRVIDIMAELPGTTILIASPKGLPDSVATSEFHFGG